MAALQRERLDGAIEVLRLDRPDARNALDSVALAELEGALRELEADPALRVLVVGLAAAKDLIYTGRTLGMAQARALGLCSGRRRRRARSPRPLIWPVSSLLIHPRACAPSRLCSAS
jgi:enoyl-CoA hydratase/carnithine racemase